MLPHFVNMAYTQIDHLFPNYNKLLLKISLLRNPNFLTFFLPDTLHNSGKFNISYTVLFA
jgi:hypothetical protein